MSRRIEWLSPAGHVRLSDDSETTVRVLLSERDAAIAERDRLRRELEALRNAAEPVADALRDIAGDAHTAYLDRLDAILRGES